jgi:hypothetical protein
MGDRSLRRHGRSSAIQVKKKTKRDVGSMLKTISQLQYRESGIFNETFLKPQKVRAYRLVLTRVVALVLRSTRSHNTSTRSTCSVGYEFSCPFARYDHDDADGLDTDAPTLYYSYRRVCDECYASFITTHLVFSSCVESKESILTPVCLLFS